MSRLCPSPLEPIGGAPTGTRMRSARLPAALLARLPSRPLLLVLPLIGLLAVAPRGALAQSGPPPDPAPSAVPEAPAARPDAPAAVRIDVSGLEEDCGPGVCCPATTKEKLSITIAGLLLFSVTFLLLRAAMVSALIRRDWNPVLAAHSALSVSLVVGTVATSIIAHMVKGCWLTGFTGLACLMSFVWFLHAIFVLVAVRKR
jgi:hypothetical protein